MDDLETISPVASPYLSRPVLNSSASPMQKPGSSSLYYTESYSPTTHLAFPSASLIDSPSSPVGRDLGFPSSPPVYGGALALPSPAAVQHHKPPLFRSADYPMPAPLPMMYTSNTSLQYQQHNAPNRVTGVCLMADGMNPLKMDAFLPSASRSSSPKSASVMLKIKLSIAPLEDLRSPSTLHGFVGNVCLARVWTLSAKCITRVYEGTQCVSAETSPLDVSSIEVGTVIAPLPESHLSRCRWFKPCAYLFFTLILPFIHS